MSVSCPMAKSAWWRMYLEKTVYTEIIDFFTWICQLFIHYETVCQTASTSQPRPSFFIYTITLEPTMGSVKTRRLNVRFSTGQPKVAKSLSSPGSVACTIATSRKRLHKTIFLSAILCLGRYRFPKLVSGIEHTWFILEKVFRRSSDNGNSDRLHVGYIKIGIWKTSLFHTNAEISIFARHNHDRRTGRGNGGVHWKADCKVRGLLSPKIWCVPVNIEVKAKCKKYKSS